MGLFSFVKKIKLPKFVTGLLTVGVGIGLSAIPVPGCQVVGGKIMMTGGGIVIAGLVGKARRYVKAEKGKKWVAITEHERELLDKVRKKDKKVSGTQTHAKGGL